MDSLDVMTNGKNTLPARYRICPNDWVDGLENLTNVLRRTPLGSPDLEVVLLCSLVKQRLGIISRQGVQETLKGW